MKKVTEHFILDESYPLGEDVRVYSCLLEDGSQVMAKDMYSLGNGDVFFTPCSACDAEIQSALLGTIFFEASKKYLFENPEKNFHKSIVYRGMQLFISPTYEVPDENSESHKELIRSLDDYIDKGTPITLQGIYVVDTRK